MMYEELKMFHRQPSVIRKEDGSLAAYKNVSLLRLYGLKAHGNDESSAHRTIWRTTLRGYLSPPASSGDGLKHQHRYQINEEHKWRSETMQELYAKGSIPRSVSRVGNNSTISVERWLIP